MRWWPLLLLGCEKPAPAQPSRIESVTVAPQSTGSPNEPILLVGPQQGKSIDSAPADVEHVPVKDGAPDASWKAPKDRCPDGVTEMIAVHVPLGDSMELAPGASPVSALGSSDTVDVTFHRTRKIVRVSARKFGLVFVLTERDGKCTWYGVNSGY